ncbi:MAG: GNAT family N-acetyltransferase [Solirubrobacterales bacterium]|nr:GNAT family N-acetyltransferase [Solirubrobacterales bacterium]
MAEERDPEAPPCTIREFRLEDAEAVHRWFNNPAATRTLMEQRDSFNLENAEGWTRAAAENRGNDRKFAILVPGVEQPVGFTALYGLFGQLAPELGCMIGDEVRGRGIGRWAERFTVDRAFGEFGAHRVYGRIPAFNEAAKRVVAAQGWRHEGTMPGHVKRGDELVDLEIWGVSPDQFYAAIAEW